MALKITRIDVMHDEDPAPAQEDEVHDDIKIIYHPIRRIVHVAVISMTSEERTAWRLIDPKVKEDFTTELTQFGSSIRFTRTTLLLVVPEGAFSNLNPIENCSYNMKELEAMIDTYRR